MPVPGQVGIRLISGSHMENIAGPFAASAFALELSDDRAHCSRTSSSRWETLFFITIVPVAVSSDEMEGPCISCDSGHSPYCACRVGEAKTPGPIPDQELHFANFNPTALFGKHETVINLGKGVWTASETTATEATISSLSRDFNKAGFNCVWSHPVRPQRRSASCLRGNAGGVAIISSFPCTPVREPIPDDVWQSTRFADCVVSPTPTTHIYVAVVYGVPQSHAYADSLGSTNRLLNTAAQRALMFNGPALILGDFNCDLDDVGVWPHLLQKGWIDCASVSAEVRNEELMPTCKDARHSFILGNAQVASALLQCQTTQDHLFATHPMLLARLAMQNVVADRRIWSLPRSFDALIVDNGLAVENARQAMASGEQNFREALLHSDLETASRLWTQAAEYCLANAVVDEEGTKQQVRNGQLGRASKPVFVTSPSAMPLTPKARDGDFEPSHTQTDVEGRRRTRQLRRLQSYLDLLKCNKPDPHGARAQKAEQLWQTILGATGFHRGFPAWIASTLSCYVPLTAPDQAFATAILSAFHKEHKQRESMKFLGKMQRKKIRIMCDIPNGGSEAYRLIKENPFPPLQMIHFDRVAAIKRTIWPKEGRDKLILENADAATFDTNEQIVFQGQTARIAHVDGRTLTLDRPVCLKNQKLEVRQPAVTADRSDMHRQILAAWLPMVQRDRLEEDAEWDQMILRLDNLEIGIPPMPYTPITSAQIKNALQGTKIRSARGGDGFSTMDLRKLPCELHEWLADIFHVCEQGSAWPGRWMLAKTHCLPKGFQPKSPLDIRPVTVLGKTYRLWSKIRSQQVMAHLGSHLPPEVAGIAKAISADLMAMYTAERVEEANMKNSPVCGAIFDIVKCYNCIPRRPLMRALHKCGVPGPIVQALAGALKDMRRTFEVAGSFGDIFQTTTGIVEGCAMAVACMTVLCAWAHLQVVAPMPGLDSSFYADNWALISTSLTTLENAVRKLVAFLDDLKLRIAPDKSWTWSNKPSIRKKLRGLVIRSACVPVRHTAKDLGADVSYTRKRPYATKTKRIAKARTRLLKLGRTKIPGSFKKTVAVSAGLGCSAYGEEFVPHSKAPTHSLRVAVARALNRAGHGTNVWLALNAADTNLDPQWRAMLQRIRFWRRYVMAFPHRAKSVYARLALDPGTKPKGPVAFLAHVIRELGCTTSDDGLFIQYRQQKIAWVHAPPKLLQKFLWPQWNKYVAKQCAGRKHFDVTAFDAPLTSQVLESQAPRQRAIILACLAGKHYTSDILANYIAGCDGTCDLCGEPDGRLHRVFQCPATQAIRNEFADSVRAVAHWPEACRYFGVCPWDPELDNIQSHIPTLPDPATLSSDLWIRFEQKRNANGRGVCQVFTDGSAFNQTCPYTALASSAVVQVHPTECRLLFAFGEILPGAFQNSYRGEVYAILLAISMFENCTIYCDCQAAVQLFEKALNSVQTREPVKARDADLWEAICCTLKRKQGAVVQIRKTKAHANMAQAPTTQLKWEAFANDWADHHAKQAIQHGCHRQLQRANAAATRRKVRKIHLSNLYELMVKTADLHLAKGAERRKDGLQMRTLQADLSSLQPCPEPRRWIIAAQDEPTLACPFHPAFAFRILEWARALSWPAACRCGKDTTYVELYLDFCLFSNSRAPVCLSSSKTRVAGVSR